MNIDWKEKLDIILYNYIKVYSTKDHKGKEKFEDLEKFINYIETEMKEYMGSLNYYIAEAHIRRKAELAFQQTINITDEILIRRKKSP